MLHEREHYLLKHKPVRDQFKTTRRSAPSGIQEVHSAENSPDIILPDTGAENVANWMTKRTTPGSYHTLSDSDSTIRLVPLWFEAYHDGTGMNSHAIGISCATKAAQWSLMPTWWKDNTLKNMALAATENTIWLRDNGRPITPARRVSAAQARLRIPGFVSHGEMDPTRRSDPGPSFPWDFFLDSYAYFCGVAGIDVGRGSAGFIARPVYVEPHYTRKVEADRVSDIAYGGGALLLFRDGTLDTVGGAPFKGAPLSIPEHWQDREAARLEIDEIDMARNGYSVIATTGERYRFPIL